MPANYYLSRATTIGAEFTRKMLTSYDSYKKICLGTDNMHANFLPKYLSRYSRNSVELSNNIHNTLCKASIQICTSWLSINLAFKTSYWSFKVFKSCFINDNIAKTFHLTHQGVETGPCQRVIDILTVTVDTTNITGKLPEKEQ